MTDTVRSHIMRSVRRAHTGPEIAVRKILHERGFRFRLQQRDLPGTPDVVLRKYKTAIFVHGCFWHRHENCPKSTMPKTRIEFWREKFDRNIERDQQNEQALRSAGWHILTIWECETQNSELLKTKIENFFKK